MTLTALKGIGWPCIDRRAAQDAEKTYIAAPTARRARDAATERGRSRRSASVRGGRCRPPAPPDGRCGPRQAWSRLAPSRQHTRRDAGNRIPSIAGSRPPPLRHSTVNHVTAVRDHREAGWQKVLGS